jgi:hypothetical protein
VGCGVEVLVGLGVSVCVGNGVGEGSALCGDSSGETVVCCVHPIRTIVTAIPKKMRN